MSTELSRSENVFTALKLTQEYNEASEDEAKTRLLSVMNVIGQMDIDERYSFYVRRIAMARNVVPELVDVELELTTGIKDVPGKLEHLAGLMAERLDNKPS